MPEMFCYMREGVSDLQLECDVLFAWDKKEGIAKADPSLRGLRTG